MTEQEFLKEGNLFLEEIFEKIEKMNASLLADREENALIIEDEKGAQYLIHLHRVLKEIWVSSPFSGAHHFRWGKTEKEWVSTRHISQGLKEFLGQDIGAWMGRPIFL